ncbi:hypothetical protein RclHR1_04230006 [Rhizophagus clarus]|uniref:Uncharacterized protein n=1 Tax=Rhizophagus clarus TaxID=94130 RepID=A0A2Z6RHS4_9GLOM|nr:hypothetical protein RclHR1_04230006 [Rhizophagus clarus]
MMNTINKIIRRKSLGRAAFIGSLYNAVSDTFCGTAILKAKFPDNSISKIDIPNSELFYEYEDSYMEKFNKLDVEAELKLSVLTGLFALEGSGKYLSDVKDSYKVFKGNLIYRITSVEENLNIYRDDVKTCISTDGFNNTVATHIVVGIKWGATVIASFECKNMNEDDKHQAEAALKSYFEKLSLSTFENDNVNVEKNQPNLMNYFSIRLLGDVIPYNKYFPQSFNEAKKVMIELPSYATQFNNGKGFPIEYIFYPLSEIAKLFNQKTTVKSMIMESSEEIVLMIEQVFDDLFKQKQRLNDLFNDAKLISHLIPDKIFEEINDHVQEIKLEEKGVLSKSSIMAFIDRYRSVSTKADLVLTLKAKKVEYLEKDSTIEDILRRNSIGHIYILIDGDIVNGGSSPVHSIFQDLYNSNEKSSKFFVVDPKICPEIKSPGYPHEVEYGYNRHLYCGCGESSIDNCKFKCNNPLHTEGYISFDLNTLITLLPKEPPEEINILLLGETGVGKSTFINAFANYLKFDTLNEAKSGKMEALISSKFTITDNINYETKTIKIGNDDSNERLENIGMSSTQECKSYVFQAAENKIVRLIDTPGIGDTRGLDQDKKNFENILKFCIQELLSHLHRNAKDNIVFCFTNARGTFYRPGDTLPPLKKQLEELNKRSGVEIKVNHETTYCFDNKSFRFLAAIKEPDISFTDADEKYFSESWNKSVDESLRLILYLVGRPPHIVKDTLSLNNSRNIVILLSKPLAEIGQLIQTNIKLIKEQQNEIKNSDKTIEELKDQLYIPQVDIEPVSLEYPRTVCTSISCVKSVQIGQTNIKKIEYITHCHRRCYCLKNATINVVNDAALRGCSAMSPDGTCMKCGFLQISKKKSDRETKRAIIEDYQKRVNQLQKEQRTINEISLKLAQFLRQNAIAAFNDTYADYFDHFINEEKIKNSADPNRYDEEILKRLEATKRSYLEQNEVIKKAMENNDPSMPSISPNDVANLEQQLYNLPINDNTLKKIKYEAKRSQTSVFRYKESYYSRSKTISNTFAKIFK